MNSGKVVLGLLAGVAVGAILGILFAPEKGSVTRSKISKKGHDMGDDLNDKIREFTDMISKQFESFKEEAMDMAKKGTEQARDAAEGAASSAKKST